MRIMERAGGVVRIGEWSTPAGSVGGHGGLRVKRRCGATPSGRASSSLAQGYEPQWKTMWNELLQDSAMQVIPASKNHDGEFNQKYAA